MTTETETVDAGATDTATTPDTTAAEAATTTQEKAESTSDAVARALAEEGEPDGGDATSDEADGADGEHAEAKADGDTADAEPDKPQDAEPKADAQDDELKPPEGLSQKASERFSKLVDRVKAGESHAADLQGKLTDVRATLEGTGASPEQWGRVLTAMRYANSGDPQQARSALEILDGYRAEIAAVAGVPVQGVDVLADFPDLRDKVDNGDMDEQSAAELATSRRIAKRTQDRSAQAAAEQQAQAEYQSRVSSARQGLDTMGAQLQKSDVDYGRKIDLLKARGFFDKISANVAPEQWSDLFRAAYDALGDAVPRTPAPAKGEEPMRRSGASANNSAAKPKTTADAVRLALAQTD